MEPARRMLLLVLFASVLAADPTHARAAGPEQTDLPAAARWVQRLAVALRHTARAAPATPMPRPRLAALAPRPIRAQVTAVHPALLPHAFRLPPPATV